MTPHEGLLVAEELPAGLRGDEEAPAGGLGDVAPHGVAQSVSNKVSSGSPIDSPRTLGLTWPAPIRIVIRTVVVPATTFVVATFAIFAALTMTAGDPVSQLLGPRATDAQREAMRADLGLDDPLLIRYWHWLTSALHGDFGLSTVYRSPVVDLISARLGVTLFLVVYAGLMVLLFGLSLGILGAVFRPLRPIVVALNGLLIAIPSYVAAFILISTLAVGLHWFPTSGTGEGFTDELHHLTLPAIALALGWIAYLSQMTRAAVLNELDAEHVATARGRGLPPGVVFRRHVLRNAAGPIITVAGTIVAYLVTGAVIVEATFGVDGLGSFLVKSVASKDTNVVLAINLLLVTVFVASSTLVELIQRALDPRVRQDGPR